MFDNGAQVVLCYENYKDVFVIFVVCWSYSPPLNFISDRRHFVL